VIVKEKLKTVTVFAVENLVMIIVVSVEVMVLTSKKEFVTVKETNMIVR